MCGARPDNHVGRVGDGCVETHGNDVWCLPKMSLLSWMAASKRVSPTSEARLEKMSGTRMTRDVVRWTGTGKGPRRNETKDGWMKALIGMMAAVLLLAMAPGCKDPDRLAELDEMERLLERMGAAPGDDSLCLDNAPGMAGAADMASYDSVTSDSVHGNAVKTLFRKARLEGHDYWVVVGVGERTGGTGITHSESCRCNRPKTAGMR